MKYDKDKMRTYTISGFLFEHLVDDLITLFEKPVLSAKERDLGFAIVNHLVLNLPASRLQVLGDVDYYLTEPCVSANNRKSIRDSLSRLKKII